MWTDKDYTSKHASGHEVVGFSAGVGARVEWWAYPAGFAQRPREVGLEPMGPFRTMSQAKRAVETIWLERSA